MRRTALALLVLSLSGCLGLRDRLVKVSDTDGSADHRLFRIGSVTRIMMEPVLWKLEDLHLIDFDRPVTDYLKDRLPPEFETVTLRMLHDNRSGLPLALIDPCHLPDLGELLMAALAGTHLYRTFDRREAFLDRLWEPHYRMDVRRREPRQSNVGYALMMMAICDRLGVTLDDLCEKYLIRPYGLKDTAFVPYPGMRPRLTRACAGTFPLLLPAGWEVEDWRGAGEVSLFSGGMLSSAFDILRVCYVILPHLDRAKGMLVADRIDSGHDVWYLCGTMPGGHAFVGFDPEGGHAVAILENATRWSASDGLELLENLANPPGQD